MQAHKNPYTRFIGLVVLCVVVISLVACGGAGDNASGNGNGGGGKPAKIGLGAPLTGTSAFDGQMIRDGAQLAVDQAKGKLSGLQLVVRDDKADPKEGAAIANELASDDSVMGYVGDYNSSVTLAAAPILGRARITQISPGSSSPKITGYSKWLFRTEPTDKEVGLNMVKWAIDAGYKKVAVIYEDTDFGKGSRASTPRTGRKMVGRSCCRSLMSRARRPTSRPC